MARKKKEEIVFPVLSAEPSPEVTSPAGKTTRYSAAVQKTGDACYKDFLATDSLQEAKQAAEEAAKNGKALVFDNDRCWVIAWYDVNGEVVGPK